MKKWGITALVVGLFLLLAIRGAYIRFGRSRNEKREYAMHLGFHFSARVDSIKVFSRKNGLVYFHVTFGEHDLSSEDQVNKKLRFNASLRFVLKMPAGKKAFHSRDLDKYQIGDSIAINSDLDKIFIYRQGQLGGESNISHALSGRVF
jgi:hypothetical protein